MKYSKILTALPLLLIGCATTKNNAVEIPVANVTSVYQPPSVSSVTVELVAAGLLIVLILYILISKLSHRKTQEEGS